MKAREREKKGERPTMFHKNELKMNQKALCEMQNYIIFGFYKGEKPG